jgi:DNA-binding FadR family transcriptional regulator
MASGQQADSIASPRPMRIHQAIARTIGIAIVTGDYQPGQAIGGGEIEQAQALGVSRTAYREAMRILTAKGLLASRPKAGTRVTPRAKWNLLDPDVLEWMFSTDSADEAFILQLFELRGIIEPAAAALAAMRADTAMIAQMRAALDAMRDHGLSTSQGREADQRFHSLILRAAGNEPLANLSSTVSAAVTWTTRFKQRFRNVPRDPYAEHVAVWQAIAMGDADGARQCMTELLHLALEDMQIAP